MNPLYVSDNVCNVHVTEHCLEISNPFLKKIYYRFSPRNIPFDSIIIQKPKGALTFDAMNWLLEHAVSFTVLDWRGNILSQILPSEPITNELKIAQYQAYLDKEKHVSIVKTLVKTKIQRQFSLLRELSSYYKIRLPQISPIDTEILDFIRNIEAQYASLYFNEYTKICKQLGYDFNGRKVATKNNMHASDLVNSLLNYSYAVLQTYVRRAINSIGLDNTIPFLHYLRKGQTGLVYDLMELWRANCDYSVLQTLEELNTAKYRYRAYETTDRYEVMITENTAKLLIGKIRLNLELFDIINNTRRLAKYILNENKKLDFNLQPIFIRRRADAKTKQLVQTKNYKELGMNKSTLWYQRKRLNENKSLRIYNKSRQYFV